MAEVAITVQFSEPIIDWMTLAAFTVLTRTSLPQTSQQPPLPRMEETFDVAHVPPSFQITFEQQATLPRTWFTSAEGDLLVQIQADRLGLNWRKTDDGAAYPRYEELRPKFDAHLDTLIHCLEENGVSRPSIDMCEVLYLNPIELPATKPSAQHPDMARIFNRFRGRPRSAFLPPTEDAQYQARFRIPGVETPGQPVGRLHAQIGPALKPPLDVPIYVLTMTARLRPENDSLEAAAMSLDRGHEWVVLGFKDLTTTRMHEIWGLVEKSAK